MKIINIELEDNDHKNLKVICAKQGETMQRILKELIHNFVNKYKDAKEQN